MLPPPGPRRFARITRRVTRGCVIYAIRRTSVRPTITAAWSSWPKDATSSGLRQTTTAHPSSSIGASERMIASLAQDSWCIAVFGLVRTEVLRRTAVMGNYMGSDVVFLAEISLYGRFAEVPEYLQFRRLHPGAYSHEVTPEKVREFYTPWKKGKAFVFRNWRHMFEYLRAVGRAPLQIDERIGLFVYVLRMVWWHRGRLVGELTTALRSVIGSQGVGRNE